MMFSAVALCAVLSVLPTEADDALKLSNVRLTYGLLGPTRPNAKVLPGDSLYVAFEISGITTDDEGKIKYSTGIELFDAKNKSVFRQAAQDHDAINSLGGNTVPSISQVDIGLEQPAGEYSLKVTVTDKASKKSDSFTQKFEVLPRAFGLVHLALTTDAEGRHPTALLGSGQVVWLHANVVAFGRDKAKSQPNLSFELSILDEAGKPTVKKPVAGVVNSDIPAKSVVIPVQYLLSLNRPGKYTVSIKATDQVGGGSFQQNFPLTVLPAGK